MSTQNPTLQIPADVINPIIQANISAAVATALGPVQPRIAEFITSILRMSVDSEGKPSSYNARPWIDWAIGNAIRAAAKEAIEEQVEKLKGQMKAHIGSELTKKNSPLHKQIAEGLVNGAFSAESLKWRLNITAEPKN